MSMQCDCGEKFTQKRYLTRHRKTCQTVAALAAESHKRVIEQAEVEHARKRLRGDGESSSNGQGGSSGFLVSRALYGVPHCVI